MKITFLAPHVNIAGGTRAILKYSDLLVQLGHDVEITIAVPSKLKRLVKQTQRLLLNEPRWQPTRASIRYVPSFADQHLRASDVTIATAWKTAYALRDAGNHVGWPFYFVQHLESLYHGQPAEVDGTYRLGFETITISTWLRNELKSRFGVDPHVIVTPVDQTVFFKRARMDNAIIRICIMDHPSNWKDVPTALAAVERFRQEGGEAKLVVFGATRNPQLEAIADEAHWGKSQHALASVFSSCDVYLCSSWYEGLGMPAMEAMACGCALVTTDTGGCLDYAINGKTALVADQRDVEMLARHLYTLANDSNLRATLQEAGRQKVCELNWEAAASIFRTS